MDTAFDFTLPRGYVDEYGTVHKEGSMRLATALDEIEPIRDPRVRQNEAYLTIIILSRVITRLGNLREVKPELIEKLFLDDFVYLQDFYAEVNGAGVTEIPVVCPECGHEHTVEVSLSGGSKATP